MRDNQRHKVYRFELEAIHSDENCSRRLTQAEAKIYFQRALKRYGIDVKRYRIEFRKRRGGVANWERISIPLQPRFWVLLHEAAHIIVGDKAGRYNKVQAHGPEFASVLADLYTRYLPLKAVISAMKSYGITVATNPACSWKKRRIKK